MAEIEIFGAPNCGYCQRAKALLKERSLHYEERDISDSAQHEELARRLPRVKSIPQIFINGEHIGGFEDLELMDRRGALLNLTGQGEIT